MSDPTLLQRSLPYLTIVAASTLTYLRCLGFDYTYYDDYILIAANQDYLSDPFNLLRVFRQDAFAYISPVAAGVFYRPLLWVSFILNFQIGGVSPAGFHAVNLLLHVAVSALVFRLLLRLGYESGPSLFLALVFALHPVQVPVAAWIPCQNDSMLAVCVIFSLLCLLRFLRDERWGWLLATLAWWGTALFVKEAAIALFGVAPLLALVRRATARPSPRLLLLGVAWVAIAAVWFAIRRAALGPPPRFGLRSVLENLPSLLVYLGKVFVPFDLSVMPAVTAPLLGVGAAALAGLAALIWLSRDRLIGMTGVGLVWYFGFLSPVLFVSERTRGLEHRLYVPMIGMLIVLADARWPQRLRLGARARVAAAVALLAVLALLTSSRLPEYANGVSFWESAIHTASHKGRAFEILSARYLEAGRLEEAERACRTSMSLHGNRASGQLQLGLILAAQNELSAAEKALREAVALDPKLAEAWRALADVKQRQGDVRAAESARQRAAALVEHE